jgi:hypothetical protein
LLHIFEVHCFQRWGLSNFAGIPLELLKSIQIGPWPEEEGEQRKGGHVPAERATGGEVRGEEKFQGRPAEAVTRAVEVDAGEHREAGVVH